MCSMLWLLECLPPVKRKWTFSAWRQSLLFFWMVISSSSNWIKLKWFFDVINCWIIWSNISILAPKRIIWLLWKCSYLRSISLRFLFLIIKLARLLYNGWLVLNIELLHLFAFFLFPLRDLLLNLLFLDLFHNFIIAIIYLFIISRYLSSKFFLFLVASNICLCIIIKITFIIIIHLW